MSDQPTYGVPRGVVALPSRDELPFHRFERAHKTRELCLVALRKADAELNAAIADMRGAGYDVKLLDHEVVPPPLMDVE